MHQGTYLISDMQGLCGIRVYVWQRNNPATSGFEHASFSQVFRGYLLQSSLHVCIMPRLSHPHFSSL